MKLVNKGFSDFLYFILFLKNPNCIYKRNLIYLFYKYKIIKVK